MAISDALYEAWLENDQAQRVTLYHLNCVIGGTASQVRLSNRYYPGGVASNPYLAIVEEDLEITTGISISGEPQISLGDLELDNASGDLDGWLDYVFMNQTAEVYIGDIRWPIEDFRLDRVLLIEDIGPGSDERRLQVRFRDILQRLNSPIHETVLNNGAWCPVAFGEVPNMTPKYDPVADKWHYHKALSEGTIEVRTDGKRRLSSYEITDFPDSGYFQFGVAVGPGAVTCSVQGDKTGGVYRNTISALIQMLVTTYGKADTRLVAGDLDSTNLAQFESANPQPVGTGYSERTNVMVACAHLAASKGAQLVPSKLGKLRLIQYDIPTVSTRDITTAMQVEDEPPVLVNKTTPKAAVQIGYCLNHTVQPSLVTSLTQADKQLLAEAYQRYTEVDAPTATKYKLPTNPAMEETRLLKKADAIVEAQRRLAIVKVPRYTYRVTLLPLGMVLDVGQAVKLFGKRYNMVTGKVGLLSKLTQNYGTYRTTIEVTI